MEGGLQICENDVVLCVLFAGGVMERTLTLACKYVRMMSYVCCLQEVSWRGHWRDEELIYIVVVW